MPAVDTQLTNLRFAVGEMARDPKLQVSEETQSALEKTLQHCEQSHQLLMTCLNDKALKLDKLQELIKRFEKAQKCCDNFLQEKRMFLGCSEVPDVDPQSMKKLYDELLVRLFEAKVCPNYHFPLIFHIWKENHLFGVLYTIC